MRHHTHTSRHLRYVAGTLAIIVAASCGATDDAQPAATDATPGPTTIDASASTSTSPSPSTSTSPSTSAPPATTPPSTGDPTTTAIEQMLTASLTDFAWNCCGVDGTPTGAAVAIRVPGADDLLISTGSELDGAPFDPTAPFFASGIASGLVQSVAYLLVDAGLLDPTATVDTWASQMPDASAVTVQMLLDGSTGWGDFGDVGTENVVADLSRIWTLAEVVDVAAGVQPNSGTGRGVDTTVLGHILEQTTGVPLAELVKQYVTAPLGLDGTTTDIAAPAQSGYQNGLFSLNGVLYDTASVPTESYYSFHAASGAATSTLPDLLDLLDAWVTGELLGPEHAATPDKFRPDNPTSTSTFVSGLGTPVHGYCDPRTGDEIEYPCTPADDGLNVMAIGRQPNGPGTTLVLWHFPATGISIAMHHNSSEWETTDPLRELVIEIHDLIEAAD